MAEKDDWKLLNDVERLRRAELNPSDGEELFRHAPQLRRCRFCLEPVQNSPHQWWFLTLDLSCCICEACYHEFKEEFEWEKLDGWDVDWGK